VVRKGKPSEAEIERTEKEGRKPALVSDAGVADNSCRQCRGVL